MQNSISPLIINPVLYIIIISISIIIIIIIVVVEVLVVLSLPPTAPLLPLAQLPASSTNLCHFPPPAFSFLFSKGLKCPPLQRE